MAGRFKSLLNGFVRWTPANPPERNGANYFYPIWNSSTTFQDNSTLLNDYCELPEVNAVIGIKARAFSRMNLKLVSKTTGEPPKNYEDLVKLFQSPNYFQSQREFLKQTKTFREVFGNEYIYMQFPFGMSMLSTKAMFTLPPDMTTPVTEDNRPFFFINDPQIDYKFKWDNNEYILPKDNVIHLNDNRVKMTAKDWVSGTSWLTACLPNRNNIRAAYQSRGIIIERRGALGILKNADKDVSGKVPMTPEEKKELQNEYLKYGTLRDQWQLLITNLNLEFIPMTIEPDKLGLYREIEEDRIAICNTAGVPVELLPGIKGSTFENQKWAERRLYENTIIPEAQEWIDAMNAALETENKSWTITGEFGHLAVFTENQKERGAAIQLMTGGLSKAYIDKALSLEDYQAELRKMNIGEATK